MVGSTEKKKMVARWIIFSLSVFEANTKTDIHTLFELLRAIGA